MKELKILFVEDSQADVEAATRELAMGGFTLARCEQVRTRESLKRALQSETWDLVIGDYSSPSFGDLESLAMVRELRPDLPYLVASGTHGEDAAVMAMKAGANDYLFKGRLQRLAASVDREMRNVYERKRAEESLRKSEEQLRLAQRMETVGRLAGGLAHDFNNILSVVSGYANLLQMKMAKTGTAPKELMEIEKAVVKATALVQQLMAFGRKQVVQPQLLDLGAIVSDSLSMLRKVVGDGIALETRLDPSAGRVKADKALLQQILMNLAQNAKEAMPKGGILSIRLSDETLEPGYFLQGEKFLPGKYTCLTIGDTGPGLSAEILPRIFEPFFAIKNDGRGTGLALSTVYVLVRQIGGSIRVESGPSQGTTFSIRFPAVPDSEGETASADPRPDIHRIPSKGITVLLVEDDSDLRKLTKDILVLDGYQVLEPATPEDALGFARSAELKIDLLLTDLTVPGMSGKEMADAVLAIRPELRVMYLSGSAPEDLMPDAGRASEAGFPGKPFSPENLLAKVRDALDAYKVEKHL